MSKYSPAILALVCIAFFSSCVSRKKTVLFQDAHTATYVNDTTALQTDSFLNNIKIAPYDVLDVRVVSTLEAIKNLTESRAVIPGGAGTGGYFAGYFVTEQGTINLPQVGELKVAGLTLPQATDLIRSKMGKFLIEPFVEIKFMTFKVTMLGEVTSQGQLTVANEKATLSEALALSGGLTGFASIQNIKIIRGDPTAPIVYELDLTSIDAMKASGFKLLPNDIVYVPPTRGKYIISNLTVALTVIGALNALGFVFNVVRAF